VDRPQTSPDPITLAVVSGALTSIVREMSVVIERTARSPVVALSHDYSNAVYTTANGYPEMIVQGHDQPCHLGGMLSSVKSVAERCRDELAPGDVVVGNDPELNGTHLPDIDVIQPIFFEDRVVGWACSRAHEVDIGGPNPGGYNPLAADIYAEGLRIPPIKLVDRGRVREDVWSLILANVRSPHLLRGDMGAQLSAVRIATRRVQELFEKYGPDSVEGSMAELLDRAERLMRAQIASMPEGVYTGGQWIQEDGRGAPDALVGCSVEVRGDEMKISLESPPACKSYRNSYGGLTTGAVYYGVISALEPGLPINEGLYRPLEVDLGPRGTMLNAEHPAACAMSTGDIWSTVFDSVCDAMSKVVPERACAGWTRVAIFEVAGTDPRYGQHYSGLLHVALMGGSGAVHGLDGGGLWGVISTGGASTTGDIELLEFRFPLHFFEHELRCDSACPGRWRGAVGATVQFEPLGHSAALTHVGDGTKFPPPSRLGGGSPRDAERVHRKFIVEHDGRREPIPLHSLKTAEAGQRVLVLLPGGGAVGAAFERDPELVRHDVEAGFVSLEAAREEYRVVLEPTSLTLDEAATAELRDPAPTARPAHP
jgi:N-methylhydantoinase B